MLPHVRGDDVADREQAGAAMMIDYALGIARRPRSVIESYRVPFVERRGADVSFVSLRDEVLIFDLAEPLAGPFVFGIVVGDQQRAHFGDFQRRGDDVRKFPVDDQGFRLAMVEHEADRRGVEPCVERVEHRAAHRHPVMAFEHRRRIGEHDGHRVAALEAAPGERRGELAAARVKITIIAPERAVDDRRMVGKNRRGALQQADRREGLVIRGIAIEIAIIGRCGHGRAGSPSDFHPS